MISNRRVYAALVIVTVAAAGAAACGGDEVTGPGSGTPDSATPGPDTSTTTNADSSTTPDTSVVVAPIPCGMTTCDPSGQVCCATLQAQTCVAKGAPCMGATLGCTSAMSCTSGDVCCLDRMGMTFTFTSSCKPMCAGGFMEPQLCASDTECTPPDKCQNLFGGYKVCTPPNDGGFMFDGGFPKDAGGPG